ncbi:hypothetical protein EON66_03260, partial [archaeon]
DKEMELLPQMKQLTMLSWPLVLRHMFLFGPLAPWWRNTVGDEAVGVLLQLDRTPYLSFSAAQRLLILKALVDCVTNSVSVHHTHTHASTHASMRACTLYHAHARSSAETFTLRLLFAACLRCAEDVFRSTTGARRRAHKNCGQLPHAAALLHHAGV